MRSAPLARGRALAAAVQMLLLAPSSAAAMQAARVQAAHVQAARMPAVRMQAAVTVSDVEETEATIGTPGQDEKARFMLDAGVHTWEAFQNGGATPTAASNMQEVAAIFARIASKPGGATYAAAHGLLKVRCDAVIELDIRHTVFC